MIRTASLVAVSLLVASCSDPKPPPKSAADDGVPVNSASESRLAGKKPAPDTQPSEDPTKPVMTPLGGGGGGGDDDKDKKEDPKKKKDPKKPDTGAVSSKECNEALEHGLDLMIAGDPRFAGIPPEVMQNLKGQAFKDAMSQYGGQNPCVPGKGITRAEYDCEMAASTSDEFKKCEKMAKPKK